MSSSSHTGSDLEARIAAALADAGITEDVAPLAASLVEIANPSLREQATDAVVANLRELLTLARPYVAVISSDPTLDYPDAPRLLALIDDAVPPTA